MILKEEQVAAELAALYYNRGKYGISEFISLEIPVKTAEIEKFFIDFYYDITALAYMELATFSQAVIRKAIGVGKEDFSNLLIRYKTGEVSEILGFVGIGGIRNDSGYLQVYIKQEYRGKGIGEIGVLKLIRMLQDIKVKYFVTLIVETNVINKPMNSIASVLNLKLEETFIRESTRINLWKLPLCEISTYLI